MTWQRATEIVAGRTYSWHRDGTDAWVARMVDHEGDEWAFYRFTNADEVLCGSSAASNAMPYEQAPVPPWIVRTEYRVPVRGEQFVGPANGQIWTVANDGNEVAVVLIIEPNPDYQAVDNG